MEQTYSGTSAGDKIEVYEFLEALGLLDNETLPIHMEDDVDMSDGDEDSNDDSDDDSTQCESGSLRTKGPSPTGTLCVMTPE